MNKKIFFFDMDGTIVDINSNVRPATDAALVEAKAKGHTLAIATGRPYADIVKDVNVKHFDYLIANNGAYYYDAKKDSFHYNGHVNKEHALEFLKLAKETKSMFAVHCNGQAYRGHFHVEAPTDNINSDPNGDNFEFSTEAELTEMINKFEIAQVSIRNKAEVISGLEAKYVDKFKDSEMHIANEIYLDVNPKGVSKLLGVESVLEHENMSLDQAVAFGDSGNDLQMVKGVGVGIAMGNATQNLKDIADVVIGDNNSDAIADKVRELI